MMRYKVVLEKQNGHIEEAHTYENYENALEEYVKLSKYCIPLNLKLKVYRVLAGREDELIKEIKTE